VGRLVLGFGPRPKPTPLSPPIHYGQDYGWKGSSKPGVKDQVFAARGGTVAAVAKAGAYGLRLIIDHGDGFKAWYCHHYSSFVVVGDTVSAGEVLGMMGASGNVTAKHLHFELRDPLGRAVDPAPYFSATSGGEGTPLPVWEDDTMFRLVKDDRSDAVWIVGATGKRKVVANPRHLTLLQRVFDSTHNKDPMLDAELVTVATYLAAVNTPDALSVNIADIATAVANELDARERKRLGPQA
jgi:hypothetical protein